MKEPIRYSRVELLSWQGTTEEAGGQWARVVECMDASLLHQLSTTHHRPINIDRRQRHDQNGKAPLSFRPAEFLSDEMISLNGNGCQDLNEEEDVYEESDDEGSLQPLAFLVDGEPDFESGSPQDGFEYLRRVMWETAQCPKVKVAQIGVKKLRSVQTNYMPEIPPIPTCSPSLLPTKEWVQAFLKEFSDLCTAVASSSASCEDTSEELPPIRNKCLWKSFCFGGGRSNDAPSNEQEDDGSTALVASTMACNVVAQSPYLRILLKLDEISRATLLRYHVLWLKDEGSLTYNRAMWLFALSAAVDSPLDDQTSAAFRDLLRKCAELRAEKTAEDEELYIINILMTIAGQYFGQAENLSVISV